MHTPSTSKLIIFALLINLPVVTSAGVYSWKDANGKIHFGDRPPIDREAEQVKIRVNTYQAPSEILKVDFNRVKKEKVVIYTTQRCGYCKKAKQFLRREQINYSEYDVETSKKGQRDYKKLKGRGVPIILVGDQRMNGFSEGRMVNMLETAGYEL